MCVHVLLSYASKQKRIDRGGGAGKRDIRIDEKTETFTERRTRIRNMDRKEIEYNDYKQKKRVNRKKKVCVCEDIC